MFGFRKSFRFNTGATHRERGDDMPLLWSLEWVVGRVFYKHAAPLALKMGGARRQASGVRAQGPGDRRQVTSDR